MAKSHVRFLVDGDTLDKWSGYTLAERVALFHTRYPQKRISISKLRRVYAEHGIKRK